jgi:electron transport complex protein RnfB
MARLAAPPVSRARFVAEIRGCQGCGACLLTCPEHAIRPRPAPGSAAHLVVLADRCTGCGECVEVCPVDAIDLISSLSERPDKR